MSRVRIALAQLDLTVGDLDANAALISDWVADAARQEATVVVFPELALSGYPPEDLLLRTDFLDATEAVLGELASSLDGPPALVGFPEREGAACFNSVAILAEGRIAGVYRKMQLPNYSVFDEKRYFQPGGRPMVLGIGERRLGLSICEDLWVPGDPERSEAAAGAEAILNCSASPFHLSKGTVRENEVVGRVAREAGVPVALCNLVGGQDELVFDGNSIVVGPEGELLASGAQFEEELVICDLDLEPREPTGPGAADLVECPEPPAPPAGEPLRTAHPRVDRVEEAYGALRLGLRDYARKNGFERVVFGLSGGIDSALVAVLAAEAFGPKSVTCLSMPSAYSSEGTREDARRMAESLGVEFLEVPIELVREAFEQTLEPMFEGTEPGLAEENLQSRIRGNLVMAMSNKFGWLPLATGNKSEMSVGYSTLYGDMAGGFAPIKDVLKTLVYELCEHVNATAGTELIPRSVIDRPPSAELRPDQVDTDSLPPYGVLDPILEAYVERDLGREAIIAEGHPEAVVDAVIRLVDRAEYKRRQAPPGVKITPKAFGRDRRLPISNRYSG